MISAQDADAPASSAEAAVDATADLEAVMAPTADRSEFDFHSLRNAKVVDVAEADHHVALQYPELLFDALASSDARHNSDT